VNEIETEMELVLIVFRWHKLGKKIWSERSWNFIFSSVLRVIKVASQALDNTIDFEYCGEYKENKLKV